MEEIKASKIKTEPGLKDEDPSVKAKYKDCPGGSVKTNGKQNAPVIAGGVGRKSYHASVYLSSFQSFESRRYFSFDFYQYEHAFCEGKYVFS